MEKQDPGWLFSRWLAKTKVNPFPFVFGAAVCGRHPCPGWQLPHSSRWFPATGCLTFPQPHLPFSTLFPFFAPYLLVANFKLYLIPAFAESSSLQLSTRFLLLRVPSLAAAGRAAWDQCGRVSVTAGASPASAAICEGGRPAGAGSFCC